MITSEQLVAIMPYATKRVGAFIAPLNAAMKEFEINTPLREAMFLAQVAHESGELRYMEEIHDGSHYEGRKDLGNTQPGDGKRFKGRGPIQITGRNNYASCGAALRLDLVGQPHLLTEPDVGCRASAWWWKSKGLNEISDTGDISKATKRVNGGLNGIDDRTMYYTRAKQVLMK